MNFLQLLRITALTAFIYNNYFKFNRKSKFHTGCKSITDKLARLQP